MKDTYITACYKSAGMIRTATASDLSQRGADVEYIVVDGGSTDETVEILKNCEKRLLDFSIFQLFKGKRKELKGKRGFCGVLCE